MAFKDYVTKEMLKKAAKKVGGAIYEELVYPAAKKVVEDSSTPYDDAFLQMMDSFVKKELLEE